MAKLYFNNRDEITCIESDLVAVVRANGNYSCITYISKKEVTLTRSISNMEEILKSTNNRKSKFIRLGRSIIINHAYFQKIDLLKQTLILGDFAENELRIKLPKQVLKSYKSALATYIKNKENANNNQNR